jgi:hypothetical protein
MRPTPERAPRRPHARAGALSFVWLPSSSLRYRSVTKPLCSNAIIHDRRTPSAPAASLRSRVRRVPRSIRVAEYGGRRASSVRSRRPEATLISLRDRNGEILGPPPPEIRINCGAAFANRHHCALDQRKMALFGQHIGGAVGVDQVIVRAGPKAKLGPARGVFAAQKFHGAGPAAGFGRHARAAGRDQIGLHRMFRSIAHGKGISHHATIAIGLLRFRKAKP